MSMADVPEGVSGRQLLAAFFAVVVLCAVFFSLGFLLGHQGRSAESGLATEQVPATSSDAPPAVNPRDQQAPSDASAAAAASAATPAAGSTGQGKAADAPSASSSPAESSSAESPAPAASPRQQPAIGQVTRPASARPVAVQTPAGVPPEKLPPGSLVQVAALGNEQDANNLMTVLQSRGYPALILTPQQAHANDSLFRVAAGPYKTRAETEKARNKLSADGFKPFIRP
jgi:cell division septation protein DedD